MFCAGPTSGLRPVGLHPKTCTRQHFVHPSNILKQKLIELVSLGTTWASNTLHFASRLHAPTNSLAGPSCSFEACSSGSFGFRPQALHGCINKALEQFRSVVYIAGSRFV